MKWVVLFSLSLRVCAWSINRESTYWKVSAENAQPGCLHYLPGSFACKGKLFLDSDIVRCHISEKNEACSPALQRSLDPTMSRKNESVSDMHTKQNFNVSGWTVSTRTIIILHLLQCGAPLIQKAISERYQLNQLLTHISSTSLVNLLKLLHYSCQVWMDAVPLGDRTWMLTFYKKKRGKKTFNLSINLFMGLQ